MNCAPATALVAAIASSHDAKLRRREADWQKWLEPEVAAAIEEHGLFGYGRPEEETV